jgi:hypothetical protein
MNLNDAGALGSANDVAHFMTHRAYDQETLRVALIRATQGPSKLLVQCLELMLSLADFSFACPDTNTALDHALRSKKDESDEYVALLLLLSKVPCRETTELTAKREHVLRENII